MNQPYARMESDKKDPSDLPDESGSNNPDGLSQQSRSGGEHQPTSSYSKNEVRKAILKLDLTVLPLVSIFYFFSSLDRSNIGNARVAGLQSDLKLSDHQYSVVLTLTFITYVLIKVPANLVVKRIGAHVLLPLMSASWGLVTFCQGFVSNFGGLAATRLFIGLTEGGLYPVTLLYLSQNYTRDQLQLRIAIFFSSASLSGSFSGLLAYAILHLDGTWGKPGWAWLFFLEGLATMAFAISVAFIFPASINANRCLTRRDKEVLTSRTLRKSPCRVDEKETFQVSEVIAAIKSPHVLILTLTQFLSGTATYSVAYFTPTIVRSLGYSPSRTQLMTSPPFAAAFVFMLASGYFSDRYQARALTAGVGALLGLVGYIIFLTVDSSHTHVKYASLFLAIPGTYSMTPPIGAWASNNSFGHYRRAVAISFSYTTSTLGGIASTWLFPHSQAPKYRPGIIVNLLCCAGVILGVTLNSLWLRRSTRYKRTHRTQILEPYGSDAGIPDSPEFEHAWKELGDKHPDFRYVY